MIKHSDTPANRLFDSVIHILRLKNDAALCHAIRVAPPVISKIRKGKIVIQHNMFARIHEATGVHVSDLKLIMNNDAVDANDHIIRSQRSMSYVHHKNGAFNYVFKGGNANYFLDALLKLFGFKNDAALCKVIDIPPPMLSKIRTGRISIGSAMFVRLHELTGYSIAELRSLLIHSAGEFCMTKSKNIRVIHATPKNEDNEDNEERAKHLSTSQTKAHNERNEFCNRLRQCLTAAGIRADSPTTVARAFNSIDPNMQVTVHAVRKWIVGEMIPTQEKIKTLSGWLNVPSSWLRYGEGDAPREEQIKSSVHSPEEMRIMRDLKQLSQADANLVLALINRLAKQGSNNNS